MKKINKIETRFFIVDFTCLVVNVIRNVCTYCPNNCCRKNTNLTKKKKNGCPVENSDQQSYCQDFIQRVDKIFREAPVFSPVTLRPGMSRPCFLITSAHEHESVGIVRQCGTYYNNICIFIYI